MASSIILAASYRIIAKTMTSLINIRCCCSIRHASVDIAACSYLDVSDNECLRNNWLEAPRALIELDLSDRVVNQMTIMTVISVRTTYVQNRIGGKDFKKR